MQVATRSSSQASLAEVQLGGRRRREEGRVHHHPLLNTVFENIARIKQSG
jgi:hypothetical protein